jgi:hypothetical protein
MVNPTNPEAEIETREALATVQALVSHRKWRPLSININIGIFEIDLLKLGGDLSGGVIRRHRP